MDPLGNRLPFTPPLQPPATHIRGQSIDGHLEVIPLARRIFNVMEEPEMKRLKINHYRVCLSISLIELFEDIVLLRHYSLPGDMVTRYRVSDYHIQCWHVTFQSLGQYSLVGYSLSSEELRDLFYYLNHLMNAENFDVLWEKIESVLGKILKHNLDVQNFEHVANFVPGFLYHLAALHPQITLQKDLQVFLFEFLRKRNQAWGQSVSIMYSYGIFAHFTDPEKFLEQGKDFIYDTSARDEDFPFLAETYFTEIDPGLFHNQFIKIIHMELSRIFVSPINENSIGYLGNFLRGFSLFGPSIKNYLTETSKPLLLAILEKSIPLFPLDVLTFLRRINLRFKDLQLSDNFVETLIKSVWSICSAKKCKLPFMDLAALFEENSLPLSKDYTTEINDILSNAPFVNTVCETTILTLEALALLSTKGFSLT